MSTYDFVNYPLHPLQELEWKGESIILTWEGDKIYLTVNSQGNCEDGDGVIFTKVPVRIGRNTYGMYVAVGIQGHRPGFKGLSSVEPFEYDPTQDNLDKAVVDQHHHLDRATFENAKKADPRMTKILEKFVVDA